MRTCDAAVQVLSETDNSAVMWGDCGLLDLIAERAGVKAHDRVWKRHQMVLGNLSRCHAGLIAGYTTLPNNRRVRIFWLPENAPAHHKLGRPHRNAA